MAMCSISLRSCRLIMACLGKKTRLPKPDSLSLLNNGHAASLFHPSFRRSMFTDEYLGLYRHLKKVKWNRIAIGDSLQFQKNIKVIYENSGAKSIFTDDLEKLIGLAATDDDFQLIKDILFDCLGDDIRMSTAVKLFPQFFFQCLTASKVNQARDVWNRPEFKSAGLRSDIKIRMIYYTGLFREEQYQEVVDTYKEQNDLSIRDELVIFIGALAKIGTVEAFAVANQYFDDKQHGRIVLLYAYLGCKVGQYGRAWDTLHSRRPKILTINLKIQILTELGRLNDAVLLVRSVLPSRDEVKSSSRNRDFTDTSRDADDSLDGDDDEGRMRRYPRPYLCVDVMKNLSAAIQDKNDSELLREWKNLCGVLDTCVTLSNLTLAECLFRPIRPGSDSIEPSATDHTNKDYQRRRDRRKRQRERINVEDE